MVFVSPQLLAAVNVAASGQALPPVPLSTPGQATAPQAPSAPAAATSQSGLDTLAAAALSSVADENAVPEDPRPCQRIRLQILTLMFSRVVAERYVPRDVNDASNRGMLKLRDIGVPTFNLTKARKVLKQAKKMAAKVDDVKENHKAKGKKPKPKPKGKGKGKKAVV
ncbi:hypothetical protein AURDEDRAFT_167944 [Auricularia subglabra TFB-10046 SS5]|nr:hypothetical protein AURDEDRAFT_167944 [Auricularia subglabra TFB-10046 SS5]